MTKRYTFHQGHALLEAMKGNEMKEVYKSLKYNTNITINFYIEKNTDLTNKSLFEFSDIKKLYYGLIISPLNNSYSLFISKINFDRAGDMGGYGITELPEGYIITTPSFTNGISIRRKNGDIGKDSPYLYDPLIWNGLNYIGGSIICSLVKLTDPLEDYPTLQDISKTYSFCTDEIIFKLENNNIISFSNNPQLGSGDLDEIIEIANIYASLLEDEIE